MSDGNGPIPVYDEYAEEAQRFAASINPKMENVLAAAAGVIEAMGVFAALLDDAGQTYAKADYRSDFKTG